MRKYDVKICSRCSWKHLTSRRKWNTFLQSLSGDHLWKTVWGNWCGTHVTLATFTQQLDTSNTHRNTPFYNLCNNLECYSNFNYTGCINCVAMRIACDTDPREVLYHSRHRHPQQKARIHNGVETMFKALWPQTFVLHESFRMFSVLKNLRFIPSRVNQK